MSQNYFIPPHFSFIENNQEVNSLEMYNATLTVAKEFVLPSLSNDFSNLLIILEDGVFNKNLTFKENCNVIITSKYDILFKENSSVELLGVGSLAVMPGVQSELSDTGKINFQKSSTLIVRNGYINLYSFPDVVVKASGSYIKPITNYLGHAYPSYKVNLYNWVEDVYQLQHIKSFPAGNYALKKDIEAYETQNWNEGAGFLPLSWAEQRIPFSGNFEGHGFAINNLYINNNNNYTGLFGMLGGTSNIVRNLKLVNASINGNYFVGAIAGLAYDTKILNVKIKDIEVQGVDAVGCLIGTASELQLDSTTSVSNCDLHAQSYFGRLFGVVENTAILEYCITQSDHISSDLPCFGISDQDYN